MYELKKVLQKNQIIFCQGSEMKNVYKFFNYYVDKKYSIYLNDEISYSVILFINDNKEGFYENEKGELRPLLSSEKKERIKSVYIPIREELLPKGFVFILSKTFSDKEVFNHAEWESNLYKFLWFDSFPYAEYSDIYLIENIKRSLENKGKVSFDAIFITGDRQYGYSDLVSKDDSIEASKKIYKIESPMNKYYEENLEERKLNMRDVLFSNKYVEEIKNNMKEEIINLYEDFKEYFKEDYELDISEIIDPEKMDNFCSHKSWTSSKEELLIRQWIGNTKENLVYELIFIIESLVTNRYCDYISLGESKDELKNVIMKSWLEFEEDIFKNIKDTVKISKKIDRLDYLVKTKSIKIKYKEKLDIYLREKLVKDIYSYIDKKFKVWDKLLKSQA